MRHVARESGFSLLEVLIALLIFSLGLIGMAGLMVVSVKTNHSAYLRTQASFMAESMADRMRSNRRALWTGLYNGAYPVGGTPPCAGGATCTVAQTALRDRVLWSQQLTAMLPNSSANIACPLGLDLTPTTTAANPPFTGLCTMTIVWNESSVLSPSGGTAGESAANTFAWVFQP
jgi:type IV pilus assembly protein PilV